VGLVSNILSFSLIFIGFIITPMKNAYELTIGHHSRLLKSVWMTILFTSAVYTTIQSTSTVFLYFNF
ncbi:hypothetical protein, partial [Erwinia sp. MYb416]